ncbi:MAG: twin-arginine translocase subunit TatB [Chloroflexi bacterium]|nr:twin-arginine translocase subunit TatB [Chloroflexota bacterium]
MFNIGFGEILLIAIFALIFIGPERLPKVLRQLGELTYQFRQIVTELTRQFDEELRPLRDIQDIATNLNPGKQIGSLIDLSPPAEQKSAKPQPKPTPPPLRDPMAEIDKIMTSTPSSSPATSSETAPDSPATDNPDPN